MSELNKMRDLFENKQVKEALKKGSQDLEGGNVMSGMMIWILVMLFFLLFIVMR